MGSSDMGSPFNRDCIVEWDVNFADIFIVLFLRFNRDLSMFPLKISKIVIFEKVFRINKSKQENYFLFYYFLAKNLFFGQFFLLFLFVFLCTSYIYKVLLDPIFIFWPIFFFVSFFIYFYLFVVYKLYL